MNTCRTLLALTLALLVGSTPARTALEDAPANTWVQLASEPTGGREWPVFFFDPAAKQLVLSAGGYEGPAHFDTELFDPVAAKWTNAYPKDAPYKAASGPTDAAKVAFGDTGVFKVDAHGVNRILRSLNPYLREPGTYHQWAYSPDDRKLYAYFMDHTLAFDPAARVWSDLKAPKFSKSADFPLTYGALAYDPVNKEVLSLGGTSDEDGGSPGTWAFNIAAGTWKRVPAGSPELTALSTQARTLRRQVAAFVNACRNRFYHTESAAETGGDLAGRARGLAAGVEKLGEQLKAARPVAATALARFPADCQTLAGKLGGKLVSATLLEAQALVDALERAERALDAEPCGRGVSQMATDLRNGKILLFGGCRLSGYLADTWVYDCKSRTWEQRYPARCPAPRCGHTLAWLPRSGKFVLQGAAVFSSPYGVPHGNARPPQDVWTYDLATNVWKLLTGESKERPFDGTGAVTGDDLLVVVSRDPKNKQRRITWGMKVDPAAPDAGSGKAGVVPGTTSVAFSTPADFDRATTPDPAAVAAILKAPPANRWTLLPNPPRKPNAHPWGHTPYDTKRQQLLNWGGGHSPWHYNDLAHYSLRTATWSTGYADEYPFAAASFKAFYNQTFTNRPAVPTHLWDAAAYDPVADKVVFCVRNGTWLYDPATRAWDYPAEPRFPAAIDVSMESTPTGVVHWNNRGQLHRFDAQAKAWKLLPLQGDKLPPALGDSTGICYDGKRAALWLANEGGPMHLYDLATGTLTTTPVKRPQFIVMRETVYVPEIDMLLSAARVTGPGGAVGNLAYDIANKQWVGLELPCDDGKPRTTEAAYSSISLALHYDAKLKLLILLSNTQEVLVARIDKGSIKTFAVKLQELKKE